MSANQKPDYRPTATTQRDGSKLQTSNCRMAAIATGLDFDTLGEKKSSGAKMRAAQDDQSGGTDSGDARRAWANGYDEVLDVQDGNSWVQALNDLHSFRLIHLDVWHATVGNAAGSCLSGGGNYGHTIAVLPDCHDNQWLVNDPWCNPPKWGRVSEAKLKAGAEEWGRRVYGAATSGPGRDWEREPPTREELARAAKELMRRFHAGGNEDFSEDPGDTGGPQRVMYTATTSRPPKGDDMALIDFTLAENEVGGTIKVKEGGASVVTIDGGDRPQLAAGLERPVLGTATLAIRGSKLHYLMFIGTKELGFVLADQVVFTPAATTTPPVNCNDAIAKALTSRDTAWREWLLAGAPGQRDGPIVAAKEGS